MNQPMRTPPIPHTIVSQIGMLSLSPGATNFPSRPMMMPAMMTPRISILGPSLRAPVAVATVRSVPPRAPFVNPLALLEVSHRRACGQPNVLANDPWLPPRCEDPGMDGAQQPRRARHLMDPTKPRPQTTPEDLARLARVQKWVASVLAVTTIEHLALGFVLAALYVTPDSQGAQIGLCVIAAVTGMVGVAAGF